MYWIGGFSSDEFAATRGPGQQHENVITRYHILAAVRATQAIAGPAVVWDLSAPSNANTNIGPSHTFDSVSGVAARITASGFLDPNLFTSTDVFSKHDGGDENGLGLARDPTGNNEIFGTSTFPNTFIQIGVMNALAKGVTGFHFSMGSTTGGEKWTVFGANATGPGTPFTDILLDGITNDEGVDHVLFGGFKYYDFFYDGLTNGSAGGDNVLLSSFAGIGPASSPTGGAPEPSTWAMGLIGFGLVGALGFKRARKNRLASI